MTYGDLKTLAERADKRLIEKGVRDPVDRMTDAQKLQLWADEFRVKVLSSLEEKVMKAVDLKKSSCDVGCINRLVTEDHNECAVYTEPLKKFMEELRGFGLKVTHTNEKIYAGGGNYSLWVSW